MVLPVTFLQPHAPGYKCRLQDGATDKEAQDLAAALHAGTKQLAGLLNQSAASCLCSTAMLRADRATTPIIVVPVYAMSKQRSAKCCSSFSCRTLCLSDITMYQYHMNDGRIA